MKHDWVIIIACLVPMAAFTFGAVYCFFTDAIFAAFCWLTLSIAVGIVGVVAKRI